MLEKLVEVLGEELSNQVASKLTEAKIELAIFNDGSVVPATKYDNLKADYGTLSGKYDTDISAINKQLEEAVKSTEGIDELKGTLKALQDENTQLQTEFGSKLLDAKMDKDIDVALLKANVDENYLNVVKSQMDKATMSYDGDNLIGLNEAITKQQELFPKLFGEVKKIGAQPATSTKTAEPNSYKARYDEAVKSGHTRDAIKIKQEAFNEEGLIL